VLPALTRTTLTSRASGGGLGCSLQPAQSAASDSAHSNATGDDMDATCFIFPPDEGQRTDRHFGEAAVSIRGLVMRVNREGRSASRGGRCWYKPANVVK
jgi:hypothetical protein